MKLGDLTEKKSQLLTQPKRGEFSMGGQWNQLGRIKGRERKSDAKEN